MTPQKQNQKGMVVVGLALTLAAIVFILGNAVQLNMNIFLSSFNRNKAFYDAEFVIDKLAVQIKDAYELGQQIALTTPDRYPIDGANIVLGQLYFTNPRICVDRSDTGAAVNLPGNQICVQFDNVNVTMEPLTWRERWRTYQYAFYKTIVDMVALPKAEAQGFDSHMPALPAAIPTHERTYNINDPVHLVAPYANFTCRNPRIAGTKISQCVTFRFCTKFSGVCATENEWVYQTVILSELPRTDVED